MKKSWFVTALFAVSLCACFTPARAAVAMGGEEYLWYIESGQVIQNESGESVDYKGDSLWFSKDGGASYAKLPGLREESRRTWGRMDAALTPLENGGLRVEARDWCSTAYTWQRDYSAAELAQALAKAEPNPVTLLAANEQVAVGSRLVRDQENGNPSLPGSYGIAHEGEKSGTRIVWSTDGVNWTWASEPPEELGYGDEMWWDGSAFWLASDWLPFGYTSADGDRWTQTEQVPDRNTMALTADFGPYHFEAVMPKDDPNQWYNEVYLMKGDERDRGVLLPHMGEGIRANGIGINEMTASPGPNDTVVLTVSGVAGSFSMDYPVSSLDWCIENLSKPFRGETQPAATVTNSDGTVTLAKVAEHYRSNNAYRKEGELLRNDGAGWKKVETPFSCVFELLPYNGKTFMAMDTATGRQRLYASADGLSWQEVDALRPKELDESSEHGYASYTFLWTGERYYARLKAGEYRHGMMGHAGGGWYGKNTEVWFLDEDFQVISSHDFGRLVERIAYVDGTYYAEVVRNEGTSDHEVSGYSTSNTIYRSADGGTWTALPKEYNELNALREKEIDEYNDGIPDVLYEPVGGSFKGNLPTGDPDKPLRTVAQVENWRFVLDKENWTGRTEAQLLRNASDSVYLRELNEAIQNSWIVPGEITAARRSDGKIEVTVTDLSTPSMKCSVAYTPEELDGMDVTEMGYRVGWEADASKPEVADLTLVDMANGEKELVYRSEATQGKFMWYERAPWSNSIRLLPFSGKDFMVLDLADGKLWRSEDAYTWTEAEGDFLGLCQGYDRAEYGLFWTGKNYLACCYLDNGGEGEEKQVSGESSKVFLLDENLNILSSYDFGSEVERIGFRDGVCYADVHEDGGKPSHTLWRSADGVNWERTDIVQVRSWLAGLK